MVFYDDLISFNKILRNCIHNIINICYIIVKYILLNNYIMFECLSFSLE